MNKNKKGTIVADMFDLLLLALFSFLGFFLIWAVLSGGESETHKASQIVLREQGFRNDVNTFLQSTAVIQGREYSMAEMIYLMREEGAEMRAAVFREKATEFFNRKYYPQQVSSTRGLGRIWFIKMFNNYELLDNASGVMGGEGNKEFPLEELSADQSYCDHRIFQSFLVVIPVQPKSGPELQVVFCVFGKQLGEMKNE